VGQDGEQARRLLVRPGTDRPLQNDCRHCYIGLPAGDQEARRKELSLAEIDRIAGEAVSLGALWCLVTGGEPLLREDFATSTWP